MRVRANSLNYRDLMVLKSGVVFDRAPRRAVERWRRKESASLGKRVTRVKEAVTGITSCRFPD
jgi:hypothetical protein